jgi:arginase family enzyme
MGGCSRRFQYQKIPRIAVTCTECHWRAACGLNTGGLQNIGGRHIFANPKNVHIMCARDLDKKEERLMKKAGVDFERFEMHNPKRGKIRPQGQARSSETKDFNTVFKQLVKDIKAKGHKIILSTDIDHLIVEETGTCVGSKKNVRINRHGESPPGPPPADTYKAYAKIAHDKTFIAFDLTEVALSYLNALTNKREAGSKAFRAGTNIIASLVGGDEARLDVLTAMKSNNGNLTKKFTARLIGEAGVAPNNGKGSTSF